jgi:hypothetical protein
MRLLIMSAFLCVGLTGCLCTRHVDHCTSSSSGYDAEGRPQSEAHVEHNERKWVGLWPFQPWRVQP